ncbi:MAG: GAF domain-containing protein, partial [Candidatus Omnitrophica bacterium]|nr:GAF domain-containing protein [Candidatus Omnitrophota bacterium]
MLYIPASSDFIVNYGIEFYPLGFIPILLSLGVFAYTIVRYRLMDITIAITRTTVFIIVYSLVLGIPFALGFWLRSWLVHLLGGNWWIAPVGLMAVLATVGPFLYIYIEHKAEDKLLMEQRRYQETLKQASVGMTRIRNLRRLLDLITHIVTKTVRICYAAIYLYDKETNEYLLQVCRDKGRTVPFRLSAENSLVQLMAKEHQVLVYEEIKRRSQDLKDERYKIWEKDMRLLNACVIIPSLLEDRLLGFIVLGEKLSGQIYTLQDLNVFQVLANQAALAIENCQFYSLERQRQHLRRIASLDRQIDCMAHEMDNPLQG